MCKKVIVVIFSIVTAISIHFAVHAAGNYHDYQVLTETPTYFDIKMIWYDENGNTANENIIRAHKETPNDKAKEELDEECEIDPSECIWVPKNQDKDQARW